MAARVEAVKDFGEMVPVEVYLRTPYRPDREFVAGRVEERNWGEFEHARLQALLDRYLGAREREWGIVVVPECRLQVGADRFRVPDLLVLRAGQKVDRIVREPPLVCVEVLSPEDTWRRRMEERIADYLGMGVENVWVFDPALRVAFRCDGEGFHRAHGKLTATGSAVSVDLHELFAALARDLA